MKIIAARLIICSPDRNFVTLKIETDEGLYGLGDATLNGRELAVAAYLEEHVLPCLIGRDPFQIEDIWQYLYRGAYWRRGPVTMTAIAAVDVALWDIKGKALNTPVYNLLGGPPAATASSSTLMPTAATSKRLLTRSFSTYRRAISPSAPSPVVPGVASSYGVPKAGKPYEPAERGLPSESLWSTERYLNFVPAYSKDCAWNSAQTCIYCTMFTTGSHRSKLPALANRSSLIISSGWKIPAPPNCRNPSS